MEAILAFQRLNTAFIFTSLYLDFNKMAKCSRILQ
jgi:hypothetical protein